MERAHAAVMAEPTWPTAERGRARRAGAGHVRELVAEAKAGDRRALEELYLLHFDRIYRYLQLSVGNRHDAEDLTNQTFIKMIESIDRFVWRQAPFSAWLFRIAHNLAMDHFRAGRRWQPEEKPAERADAVEASAEDEALRTLGRETVLATMEALSREQRQVLTLKLVFDFSNAEVAATLGKTEGAIKSLQHRAVASLQRQLTAGPAPDGSRAVLA